ncbi:hypothetical protein GCM10018962_93440 [Dactylosporangium matsuzakiense]|uniref:Uncharacterized protein n=1 Tax=Dactylosporangium matsuzakiense TaxID=53360 RepID=A0A9W6KH40_9ACTN|nr:hypothetical protein GCM10017581_037230 [Dactylosporangium matsuzakiense]
MAARGTQATGRRIEATPRGGLAEQARARRKRKPGRRREPAAVANSGCCATAGEWLAWLMRASDGGGPVARVRITAGGQYSQRHDPEFAACRPIPGSRSSDPAATECGLFTTERGWRGPFGRSLASGARADFGS